MVEPAEPRTMRASRDGTSTRLGGKQAEDDNMDDLAPGENIFELRLLVGHTAQVEPGFDRAWFERLKLTHDEPLSDVALNRKVVRPHIQGVDMDRAVVGEDNPATFMTVDFFEHETQATAVHSGLNVSVDHTLQYVAGPTLQVHPGSPRLVSALESMT